MYPSYWLVCGIPTCTQTKLVTSLPMSQVPSLFSSLSPCKVQNHLQKNQRCNDGRSCYSYLSWRDGYLHPNNKSWVNEDLQIFEKWIIYSCLLNWYSCFQFGGNYSCCSPANKQINHEHQPKKTVIVTTPQLKTTKQPTFTPHTTQKKDTTYQVPISTLSSLHVYLLTSDPHLSPQNADLRHIFQVPGFKARPSTIGFSLRVHRGFFNYCFLGNSGVFLRVKLMKIWKLTATCFPVKLKH